jgi:hypothetical protein
MPKPPGNGVDNPIRGHRTRPAAGKSPRRWRPLVSENYGGNVTVVGTDVKGKVSIKETLESRAIICQLTKAEYLPYQGIHGNLPGGVIARRGNYGRRRQPG